MNEKAGNKHFLRTGAYIRLSREDGDKAESDSIVNQKKLVQEYVLNEKDLILQEFYVDDGWSGTNFNRPAFQRMLWDIENKRLDCVIVKDLSRFGRDYIDTGRYLERYFPEKQVRFISVTDGIDSGKQTYDILVPIKNIFNEQYARDISKKVHSAIKTKQKAGEFIGAFAPYGYKKSSSDKNKLIVDPYAGKIVQRIFQMYLEGMGKLTIAKRLNKEGILCPSQYKKACGENYRSKGEGKRELYWTYSAIHKILQSQVYAGDMVQGRKTQKMRGKQKTLDKNMWITVNNTHEPIIDKETWNKVQNLMMRKTRQAQIKKEENIFAGFLKCGQCSGAMVKKVVGGKENKKICYCCGTYVRLGKDYCSRHEISYQALEEIVKADLKNIAENMKDLEDMAKKAEKNLQGRTPGQDVLLRYQGELARLKKMKKAIYEDYREGLINKEEFLMFGREYREKEDLTERKIQEMLKGENNGMGWEGDLWLKKLVENQDILYLDRNIIAEMVSGIQIFEEGNIIINYNFQGPAAADNLRPTEEMILER